MQTYQLVVSPCRKLYATVVIDNNEEKVKIFSGEFDEYDSKALRDVIYLEFFEEFFIIQTYTDTYMMDLKERSVKLKFKLNTKISNIVAYSGDELIYASREEFEILKIKKVLLNDKFKEENIANVYLFGDFLIEYNKKEYENEICKLVKDYKIKKLGLSDKKNNDEVKVLFNYVNSDILINNKIVHSEKGYVDRVYLLSNGNLIYSVSSFLFPTKMIYYNITNNKRIVYNNYSEMKDIDINHEYITRRNIPAYIVSYKNNTNSGRILLYLHGGPAWNVIPTYFSWLEKTLKFGYSVVFMNYSGSTGYGEYHYKKLLRNNAKEALADIKEFVKHYNGNDIYILGESFGGYLAVLMSFYENKNIKLCMSVNGFVDYKYLYLFSYSKNVINNYFDLKTNENNPISIVQKNEIINKLIFLHSKKDIYSPIKSIYTFIQESGKDIDIYLLTDIGHYSVSYYKNRERDDIISKFLGGNYYE